MNLSCKRPILPHSDNFLVIKSRSTDNKYLYSITSSRDLARESDIFIQICFFFIQARLPVDRTAAFYRLAILITRAIVLFTVERAHQRAGTGARHEVQDDHFGIQTSDIW